MSLYLGETPLANTGYDKANTDLSNLTNTGKNIANWSNNVTNCITEIPQDIKLELNNGTLTLKAGGKVYNGNGLLATTSTDLQAIWATTGTAYISVTANGQHLYVCNYPGETVSSLPSPTTSYKLYYNTTDGKCYFDNGSWEEMSFPIAIISATGQISSIDQVFNGFGYIGSTVFALPGVKGLIPDGRNADGSLKNAPFTVSNVLTQTPNWTGHGIIILDNQMIAINASLYEKYEEQSNLNSYYGTTHYFCFGGSCNLTNGTISDFNLRTAFHALDYNDSSTISGWSMPSSKYIDLTLGASSSTYTAPANGWFVCGKQASATSQYLNLKCNVEVNGSPVSNGGYVWCYIPVRKNDVCTITYSLAGTGATVFRFIYAEGEN